MANSLQEQAQKQYQDFLTQAQKNPQLMDWINKGKLFWQKYSFRIKVGIGIFITLIVIIVGMRFGSNLASVFRPAPAKPAPIADITPTPTTQINSDLQKIQAEIKAFSVLLPDPAPPAVDPEIYLESLPIKKK